ncbi:MAG: T9SS type A sorting domain-containing protein [Bacteroidia bacterium]|nr:T9SS type A sorting domain-containing protein [Bacteroidia bacterium]
MKKNYILPLVTALTISFTLTLHTYTATAWGNDVEVSSSAPQGATSIVAKSDGSLYASVPETSLNPTHAMSIYKSIDNGATWTQLNVGGGSPGQTVVKSKMIVSSIDSILCIYQVTDSIYTLDVSTGVVYPFSTIDAEDFDVATSSTSNSLFLFVDEPMANSIRRYTSNDGGMTWGGTTAQVTGNGAQPRVYMTGTRLFLAYFGTIQPDVSLSKIVTTYYDENVPGTLTSILASFQDIVTNTTVPKHQYQSVSVNGSVWFFWTEGMSPSALKCRFSSDGGLNYGTEFIVAGTATLSIERFDSKHYSNLVTSGVHLVYYADSLQAGAADQFTESMLYRSAQFLSPQVFSTPERLNDFTVDGSAPGFNPTLASYLYNFTEVVGVLWVQNNGTSPALYFDASSWTVSIDNVDALNNIDLNIYPNPSSGRVTIYLDVLQSADFKLSLIDVNARESCVKSVGFLSTGQHEIALEFPELSSGIYFLKMQSDAVSLYRRIIIAK